MEKNVTGKSQHVFKKEENYILLVISGEYDKNEFMSFPKYILEESKKENVDKVLVDVVNLEYV